MKRYLVSIVSVFLLLSVFVTGAQPPTDIARTHWAYESIIKVLDSGLMEGYPDGSFRGQQSVDRYEMAMFVARLIDELEAIEKNYTSKLAEIGSKSQTTPSVNDNAMVREILTLVANLQLEFEDELKDIADRYYNIKLDYSKLEEALQNLESMQQGVSRRIDLQQIQIDSLNQKVNSIDITRNEVEVLRKEVVSLNKEIQDQSKTIRSLFIALGVMGAVILLVGLK